MISVHFVIPFAPQLATSEFMFSTKKLAYLKQASKPIFKKRESKRKVNRLLVVTEEDMSFTIKKSTTKEATTTNVKRGAPQ